MQTPTSLLLLASFSLASAAFAAEAAPAKPTPAKPTAPAGPKPTQANVPYGKHPKQILDFYKAESDKPTPLVFFIHGGGWGAGTKDRVSPANYLKAGISFVSVEYRFIAEATKDGEKPPVKGPLSDAARALQFVRSKAAEWNIDKTRIGASGGSAGACSSLWLAFHPDMADPKSADPVARESTRLACAAVYEAQTSLDPHQMKDWIPNIGYGGHAFGFRGDKAKGLNQFQEFHASRDKILPWIAEYSPYALVTSDDPPVYLFYKIPPALGQPQKDATHSANFGVKLQEHCKAQGVDCELVYPRAPGVKHKNAEVYLIDVLKR